MSAPRRTTAWDDEFVSLSLANATAGNQLLVQNVADPEKRGCTLVRMIVGIDVMVNQPGTVSGKQLITVGIGLVSDDAFSAGVFPENNVADDFPVGGWIYRAQRIIWDETLGSGVGVDKVRFEADLRAQRKLARSSVFLQVHNGAHEGSTFSVFATGLVRALYKLP